MCLCVHDVLCFSFCNHYVVCTRLYKLFGVHDCMCHFKNAQDVVCVCGVVWSGSVWSGVVRCGVVWCRMVWYGVMWCRVVWFGVVRFGEVWCDVVWCSVV